ncbi:GNAT family N-acetyltransferase [Facklamia miroungae]|uniref:Protein N-acetyltransferase, RimJ/RimL family n=1 Tax=Facklamia miroungae TaxID=120956 RepID=A0A1G7RJG4_9LACT|nr:GNAT family N-acetyltransferase [Facklamia miroungae]NKZ29408.1 GNAT family N-acetyltransferase [Facklamia miroungae]SDG10319.1 Protein N-acetyltransferase, RimJ/RimL family [Facklamia miroungae]
MPQWEDPNQAKQVEVVEEEIKLSIRQAQVKDARAILGLMRHIGKETKYLTTGPEGLPLDVKQERDLIRKYELSEKSLLLVVEVDDQLIGMGNLANLSNRKQNHIAEIGVSLVREYWGYGIGRMIVEELMGFAERVGISVLCLEVVTENQRAVQLYQSLGFEIKGTLSQRLRHGHFYFDVYTMEKVIN